MSKPEGIPDDWGLCLICQEWFPFEQLTNCHGASYECLVCAAYTEFLLTGAAEWWAKNGPKDE